MVSGAVARICVPRMWATIREIIVEGRRPDRPEAATRAKWPHDTKVANLSGI